MMLSEEEKSPTAKLLNGKGHSDPHNLPSPTKALNKAVNRLAARVLGLQNFPNTKLYKLLKANLPKIGTAAATLCLVIFILGSLLSGPSEPSPAADERLSGRKLQVGSSASTFVASTGAKPAEEVCLTTTEGTPTNWVYLPCEAALKQRLAAGAVWQLGRGSYGDLQAVVPTIRNAEVSFTDGNRSRSATITCKGTEPNYLDKVGFPVEVLDMSGTGGCRVCVVGRLCYFSIRLAILEYPEWAPIFKRNTIITFEGPSKTAGRVIRHPSLPNVLNVYYTIWDAGVYKAELLLACHELPNDASEWVQRIYDHFSREKITWDVQVVNDAAAIADSEAAAAAAAEAGPAEQLSEAVTTLACQRGVHGRWLRDAEGEYKWSPFSCAPQLDVGSWIEELNKRGISQISIVGDSHMRALTLHLIYLLTNTLDYTKWGFHGTFKTRMKSFSNPDMSLVIHFAFIDGIYSNREYGCSNRGQYTGRSDFDDWPDIPPTTNLIVTNAGFWTGSECTQPKLALSRSLPIFLDWVSSQSKELPTKPKVIFRSITPSARCRAPINGFIQWAHELEKELVAQYGLSFFDLWDVEAPMYEKACDNDHHYSCLIKNGDKNDIGGDVGLMVVKSFMLYVLSMPL